VRRCLPPALGGLGGLGLSAGFWLPMLSGTPVCARRSVVRRTLCLSAATSSTFTSFQPHLGLWRQRARPGRPDQLSDRRGGAGHFAAAGRPAHPGSRAATAALGDGLFCAGGAVATLLCDQQVAAPLWETAAAGRAAADRRSFPGVGWCSRRSARACWRACRRAPGFRTTVIGPCRCRCWLAAVVILAAIPICRCEISEPAEGPVSLAGTNALSAILRRDDRQHGLGQGDSHLESDGRLLHQPGSGRRAASQAGRHQARLQRFDYETFGAGSVAHSTVSEEVYYDNRSDAPQTLIFNHFYYPGWNAYLLDGRARRARDSKWRSHRKRRARWGA
jgi:hypothetical protein